MILRLMLVLFMIAGCAPSIKMIPTGSDEYLVYESDTGNSWWSSDDNVTEKLHQKASIFCGEEKVVEEIKEELPVNADTPPASGASLRFRCITPRL